MIRGHQECNRRTPHVRQYKEQTKDCASVCACQMAGTKNVTSKESVEILSASLSIKKKYQQILRDSVTSIWLPLQTDAQSPTTKAGPEILCSLLHPDVKLMTHYRLYKISPTIIEWQRDDNTIKSSWWYFKSRNKLQTSSIASFYCRQPLSRLAQPSNHPLFSQTISRLPDTQSVENYTHSNNMHSRLLNRLS